MPDSKDTTDPPQGDPPATDNREGEFWDKLDKHLDGWLDRKTKEANEQRAREGAKTGTSRTGAKRATLPDIIADLVFGPPKE